jgi:putative SOS response-associated peptidase YedK
MMAKSRFGRDLEFGRPGAPGLVIRINPTTGERSFDQLAWGLVPHDTQDLATALRPIWARAEGLVEQPMFADAFRRRRAIVPANEYFQKSSRENAGKEFTISRRNGRPMGWAGLWEGYRAPNGEIIRSYCVITVEASEDVAPIHDRQPLVLEDEDLAVWLGEDPGTPAELLRVPRGGVLECRMSSQGKPRRR